LFASSDAKSEAAMPLDLVETLSELVAIPSVNPMGRPISGPEYFEYRVTDYLQRFFDRLGLPWQRQTVHAARQSIVARENIIARLDGDTPPDNGGQVILFEAHQDTVPVDGMTIEPWTPTVREGRLYGRGSCDIKGGMTAMLGALARLAEERPAGIPTIIMACTVNEEHGYTGATALKDLWAAGADSIVPRKPDAAVVAEPTSLNVVIAHKGALRWRCHTTGRATHSSQPHQGDNAIYKMARVVQAFEAYHREFVPTLPKHALCGGATLSVGTIQGGLSVNTVPDRCTIEVDRRMIPGEQWSSVFKQITDFIASRIDFPIIHDDPYMKGSTLAEGKNAAVAARMTDAARAVIGRCDQVGVPYGTDASTIAASGVPSIVFGPGCIDQAHTCDEWLPLEELKLASEALYQFARSGL
jgi:acetylornithine deacetylase/succinyl-diaminopimelate desuccinylase-like protein